jgi:hypothetical protein
MSDRDYRFYHPTTLDIVSEVPMAKPKKLEDGTVRTTRKATIKDARAMGLLESVTSIIKETFATSKQLIDWITEQTLDACIQFPFSGNKDNPEEIELYKKMIYAKSNEFRDYTADRGKLIHACVNRWIDMGTMADEPACNNAITMLDAYLRHNKVNLKTSEKKLGSKQLGFAGTPDLYCDCEDGNRIILDIKTTNVKTFTTPYDSWKLQLGAYRLLTQSEAGTRLVQMVVDRDSGETLFLDHEDPDKWAHAFSNLLEIRFIINKFDPRKVCLS